MSETNNNLKDRVRDFWQAHPCGSKFATAQLGTKEFFELIEAHRYASESHIPIAADFASAKGKRVLEIGCGVGTDGVQFAKAGALYTGVDLTAAAVELAKKNFELRGLSGTLQTADAEKLGFPDESFDVVYSHGVLHHTPDTKQAISEVHRVLRPGGQAIVMLYHRNSYNHAVNIRVLRRVGAHLLRWNSGLRAVHNLTGEPIGSLRQHAAMLKSDEHRYFEAQEFLNNNTDGVGNPLARVYSRKEAHKLFEDFSQVRLQTYFLNKRFVPLVGKFLPRSVETQLASRWGWHLWIFAEK
ncbi:MAG TPA: class I SAM-dependent methyltransferase [Pyrinomonadaceae bacterium]|nr:class I SAM-dependent methyltransferase [Pyrinomonadaceae bacterium]